MKHTGFTHWALLTIILVLTACQPIQPAKSAEPTGEKVLKAIMREGVAQNMNEFAANSGHSRKINYPRVVGSPRAGHRCHKAARGRANCLERSHMKNIYGKLGVNNRTQALAKASELHLL